MDCLAAVCLAALLAQTPSPSSGSIAGRVLNSRTGDPVPGVAVELNVNQAKTTSDNAGNFEFPGLAAGEYRLGAAAPGLTKVDSITGPIVRLANGERARNMVIRLAPEAVLSGRVVDENGKPLEADVSLQGAVLPAGRNLVLTKGGEFRLGGLSANEYILEATASEPAYSTATYYPSETQRTRAGRIILREGEHRGDLVVVVKNRRLFKVSGQFLGKWLADGSQSVIPEVLPRGQGMRMRTVGLDKERRFVVQIPAGNYRFVVRSWPQTPERSRSVVLGFANVTVTDGDVADVVIPASPLYTVTARQRWADVNRKEPIPGDFLLNPMEGPGSIQEGKANADGTIVAANVSPDRYAFIVSRPPGAYVHSIWAGGADITQRGLDLVNASVTDVEIRFATGAAQVTGQLRDASGQPAPGGSVQFRFLAANRDTQDLWSTSATCDSNGRYLAESLAPGEYQVTARLINRTSAPQTIHVEKSTKLTLDLVVP